MTSVFSRYRYVLGGILSLVLLAAVLVQTVPFAHMVWGTLTGGPGIGLVQDMRQALLGQEAFRAMLAKHEEEALARHRRNGPSAYQRRRLVRVNLTPLGLPGFHDVFAVRVRTTVLPDTAYTSFLTRPGVVFDPEAATFFSRQCSSSACKMFIHGLVGTGHAFLRWGLVTPFRLNITEMDETSSVSIGKEPISTNEWARQVAQLHRRSTGRSFRGAPK